MVSRTNYNLNVNEGFVIFLTSKLITCFIGNFTLTLKPQLKFLISSIVHLLNGNEHIYSILDLEGEVHSICYGLVAFKNVEAKSFFEIGRAGGQQFSVGFDFPDG